MYERGEVAFQIVAVPYLQLLVHTGTAFLRQLAVAESDLAATTYKLLQSSSMHFRLLNAAVEVSQHAM